ncbi:MAG TPA: 30S ribosomal protein S8 [Candidatus Latescibacteria bacterium]|nr:30S ribosomal protein S8 [Candidatus Latescibacterota bacterium]HOF60908.1 30S ribosomal protein S8 [Candidatus Latescibacterota bacterium]HOS64702.1 30S ribosomal protein S8 [Candidatus Latescibacterota bacterium]HOT36752.1 30S ribosomal protein S8 [Candidatus Latescibacterota bacterium]HPC44593.1 30S ribosomal protein S8 [Candidatus Latescibacterota bacterium]
MSMTDPIADFLTRIRNACKAGHRKVDIPASTLKREVARILLEQGYVEDVYVVDDGKQGMLRIYLRYLRDGKPVIRGLARRSKPGLRRYNGAQTMDRVLNGLGIAIVSTSKGVMTDAECRRIGVGGEVLCHVW